MAVTACVFWRSGGLSGNAHRAILLLLALLAGTAMTLASSLHAFLRPSYLVGAATRPFEIEHRSAPDLLTAALHRRGVKARRATDPNPSLTRSTRRTATAAPESGRAFVTVATTRPPP